MKTTFKNFILGLVMVMALCYANSASADSNFATGGAAGPAGAGAAVSLDFQIVIPQFIYFRVGSIGTIDTIQFAPTADEVATAATTGGTGGDAGPGAVNVSLVSNAGGVDITETNNSGGLGLYDGTANYISYAQINTATNDGNLPAPVLSDPGSNSVSITPTAGSITNIQTIWTYTYINPGTIPAAGTYGGAANGGRVTYTAAIP